MDCENEKVERRGGKLDIEFSQGEDLTLFFGAYAGEDEETAEAIDLSGAELTMTVRQSRNGPILFTLKNDNGLSLADENTKIRMDLTSALTTPLVARRAVYDLDINRAGTLNFLTGTLRPKSNTNHGPAD